MAQPKYSREVHIERAQALYGVKPHIVIGALHGETQPLSVPAVRSKISTYLKRRAN